MKFPQSGSGTSVRTPRYSPPAGGCILGSVWRATIGICRPRRSRSRFRSPRRSPARPPADFWGNRWESGIVRRAAARCGSKSFVAATRDIRKRRTRNAPSAATTRRWP